MKFFFYRQDKQCEKLMTGIVPVIKAGNDQDRGNRHRWMRFGLNNASNVHPLDTAWWIEMYRSSMHD